MKNLIPVLALVFAFGVTAPAFAADPATPAPEKKTEKKEEKKGEKKEEKK